MAYYKKVKSKKGIETWRFTVDVGRDPITGERKQITRRGFATKKEATAAHDEIVAQYKSGIKVTDNNMTLGEYLLMWMDTHAKQKWSITTYDNRKIIIESRIIPVIGKLKLADIKPLQITKFYANLSEKYETSYMKTIHSLLRSATKQAVKWELIPRSFMDNVDAPRVKKKQMVTWTLEQVNLYFNKAKEDMESDYYIAILNSAYTGSRRGEALGLRWADCNFEQGHFSISQAVVYSKSIGVSIVGTKTNSSDRQVAIGDFLIQELKWHKAKQNQQRLIFGETYNKNDLIACKADGSPMSPRQLLKIHEKHVKRCELPYIPIHGLRHTHASALLEAGVHPKVVQERLGHSSITITMDLYSHVMPNMQKESMQKFEDAMRKSR